jgi:hypothetical protein
VGKILDALFGAVGAVNVHTAVSVGDGRLFQARDSVVLQNWVGQKTVNFSTAFSEIPSGARNRYRLKCSNCLWCVSPQVPLRL